MEINHERKGRYGYSRITPLCNSVTEPINHKCVQRLTRKMGMHALIRAKMRSRYVLGVSDAHVALNSNAGSACTSPRSVR
ncbi:IS3 family transposase [Acidovorax sp. sif0715]|nr:IS3 family transposase [Acidovorax sp. sif0732]MBV7451173.1 IS3 family transposase [Acidovorax sp. sif0715]